MRVVLRVLLRPGLSIRKHSIRTRGPRFEIFRRVWLGSNRNSQTNHLDKNKKIQGLSPRAAFLTNRQGVVLLALLVLLVLLAQNELLVLPELLL